MNDGSISDIECLMQRSQVHPQWQEILAEALATLDPDYLHSLLQDDSWLPGADCLLSAFKRDRLGVRYLLIGESPYPRRESANGIAFYDAAVGELWSAQGLSKPVNRATSLRNIVRPRCSPRVTLTRTTKARLRKRQSLPSISSGWSRPWMNYSQTCSRRVC